VDGDIIDVRSTILDRVNDAATIATEIPSLLAEAGVDDYDQILADLEATAARDDVQGRPLVYLDDSGPECAVEIATFRA
jgi:hypothetical protein